MKNVGISDRLHSRIVLPYIICAALLFAPGLIFLFARDALPLYYSNTLHPADYILEACAAAYIALCLVIRYRQKRWISAFIDGVESEVEDTVRYSVRNHPLPICIVGSDGKLMLTNDKFKMFFADAKILKTDVKEVIGLGREELDPEKAKDRITVSSGGKSWLVLTSYLNEDANQSVMLYFIDSTEHEELKLRYAEEKQCFCYLCMDNYEDILSKSKDEKRPSVAAAFETAVREWGAGLDAIVIRNSRDKYHLIFDTAHFRELKSGKFSILDTFRKIETDADFPASLSIGVGVGGESLAQAEDYAAFALDLALGRGGDQAVVKTDDDVSYFGGKVQVIESRNKGKSRVMSHALKQLLSQSARVMVMGHKHCDMDSLGASLGVHRIAFSHNVDVHIVRGEIGYSMEDVFEAAAKSGTYNFVTCDEALKIADRDTLLIIVDSHTAGMVECPKLIGQVGRIVIIDHHRKMEDFIESATLTFMEPGASSTSELISEILQYDDKVGRIGKLEANLMLAGIIVDTNNFSVKTGTRTFEAASWLRNNGADSMTVREYLQSDMNDFKQRANIISNADFSISGIAISRNEGVHSNAQLIVAQAADELLDIKGIRASFVVGETKGEVVVSARSLGNLNVQVIMEQLGGGGHITMAAAQVPDATQDEVITKLRELILENYEEAV
ncbi:MAG: DHH family phosphoesterase [Clostridiales Family XIII bacterium]|jgi:c-di-AMP phosphodiesterase-like protein|nr:DHH family phosphoesterase [Clostridiales Family XIII bacterium]